MHDRLSPRNIHSLTAFKRNSSGLMKHMKNKTDRPLVLYRQWQSRSSAAAAAYHELADYGGYAREYTAEALGRPEKVKATGGRHFGRTRAGRLRGLRMAYRVILTPQAAADLRSAYRYIRRHAPGAARELDVDGLVGASRLFPINPPRCPLAPESSSL